MVNNVMNGTYLNIDCMELMATLPDKSIDLAIVDPPYGIGEDGGDKKRNRGYSKIVNHTKKDWDCNVPTMEYFQELFRVSKNQMIFGANYYPQFLIKSMGWIFWDKMIGGDFSDGELIYTSFWRALRKIQISYHDNLKGGHLRIHPTQKPVKLYEWLLTNYAKPNDLILDTHCGSASSLIACENLGFKYIASELDKDYYSQSLQRLQNHLAQGKLFQRQGSNEIIPQKGLFE